MSNRMPLVQPVTENPPNTPWSPSRMASIPLAVAYAAVPLSTGLLRYTAGPETATAQFLPWLLLAGLGSVWAMLFRRSGVRVKKRFFVETVIFLAVAVMLFLSREVFLYRVETILPYVRELAPVGIAAFCVLWAMTFGLPDKEAFQRYGAFLGVLCIADFAAGAVQHGGLPVARWLGNADLLAGLLLVSLTAGLAPDPTDHHLRDEKQGHPILRGLVILGLAACLSRTGLFAAGWVYLFFGRGSRLRRGLIAAILFLLLGATLVLPYAQVDSGRYVDYWLWAQSVAMYLHDPWVLLTGLPVNQALPFAIPPELAQVWERVMHSPSLLGASLPQVESFWLRGLLAWGAVPVLAFLGGIIGLLSRRMTGMGAGLVAVLFAQGMSTPLFHAPELGVPLGLALVLAVNGGTATAEPAGEADPAREWDMRPL